MCRERGTRERRKCVHFWAESMQNHWWKRAEKLTRLITCTHKGLNFVISVIKDNHKSPASAARAKKIWVFWGELTQALVAFARNTWNPCRKPKTSKILTTPYKLKNDLQRFLCENRNWTKRMYSRMASFWRFLGQNTTKHGERCKRELEKNLPVLKQKPWKNCGILLEYLLKIKTHKWPSFLRFW